MTPSSTPTPPILSISFKNIKVFKPGRVQTEGTGKQGTVENIWTKEG
jgi:hypothetical protein